MNELSVYEEPTTMLLMQYLIDNNISEQSLHFETKFGQFLIIGSADCLVHSVEGIKIIEFKEYDYREFSEDIEVLHYLQLLFYYFGLKEKAKDVFGGAYCFFNTGSTDEIIFTSALIERGRKFIEKKSEEMIHCTEFLPKMNPLCISCGFSSKCKLYRDSKEVI